MSAIKQDNNDSHLHHDHGHDHSHGHSLYSELMCHLPYAIFSVAFCLTILSFLGYVSLGVTDPKLLKKGAKTLFHSFHFLHIVFAGTGALITFFRFSKNVFKGLLVGIFCASVFCTLSDAIIPFLAGKLLGVHMHFHLCFLSELQNILPFLVVGIINGLIMGKYHTASSGFYSLFSHFIHFTHQVVLTSSQQHTQLSHRMTSPTRTRLQAANTFAFLCQFDQFE